MQQLIAKTPVEAEVLKSELLRYRFTAGEGKRPYTVVTSAPPIARCLDVRKGLLITE